MIHVDLTAEQAEMLQALLEACLRDLREEIRHTDRRNFRLMLKEQEASLQTLMRSLADQSAPLPA